MKIEKLNVNGFKALEKNVINLRNISVLAGSNSVGKSSTIQCMLLIRALIEKVFSKQLQSISSEVILPLNGPYMLSLGSTKEVISWETGRKFSIEILGDGDGILFDFEAENLEETNFFVKAIFPKLSEKKLNLIKDNFYYLCAERLGPRIRHWVNENPNDINCGYQGQYTVEVLARLGDEINLVSEAKYLKGKRLAGVQSLSLYTRQWLSYIIPDTDLENAQIFGNIRSASVKFNSFFSAPNVGFGVSYVLPIIVTGLMASEGSLFILENPEAHLHPKGQSRIGYFLGCMAAAGIQIIVETHSEHVVNGIRLALLESKKHSEAIINFYNRSKNGNKLEIAELFVSDKGDLSDFPTDFFDQSQQDLLEIMHLGRE